MLTVSCKKDHSFDCFTSNGNTINETRYPGAFTEVKVFNSIDLEIVEGPDFKVEVSAGQHIIKKISTTIKDSVLTILNSSNCNFVRGYKKKVIVTVTVPQISKVENWGVGTATFKSDFKGTYLKVVAESSGDIHVTGNYIKVSTYSNGNGDIYLEGSSDTLNIFMNGTNFLYGDNFIVNQYANSETHSLGDCFVNLAVAKQLDFQIYRSGNIYYEGTPAVINDRSAEQATGRLLKK